jgi:hypothetical protein
MLVGGRPYIEKYHLRCLQPSQLRIAEEGIKKLQNYIELGFTEIVLTNSSPKRDKLVKLVAEKIIPRFRQFSS